MENQQVQRNHKGGRRNYNFRGRGRGRGWYRGGRGGRRNRSNWNNRSGNAFNRDNNETAVTEAEDQKVIITEEELMEDKNWKARIRTPEKDLRPRTEDVTATKGNDSRILG